MIIKFFHNFTIITCMIDLSSNAYIQPKSRHCVLVYLLGFSHGALDVERAYVLPILLQQRNKEVDGKMNVGNQVIFTHLNMANGYSQAQHLCRQGEGGREGKKEKERERGRHREGGRKGERKGGGGGDRGREGEEGGEAERRYS